ncbi:MAG TPA: hypothetical protein VKY85_13350 [Candidatus Angelobacter sp.]|nr:hypothetical protein [Candidatus Angelobacter sp.]
MPGMWAKLLFTYGPYGLLVFFVFAAVWVRNSIKDEAGIQCCLIGMAPTSDFRSPFEDLYMRRVYEAKTQSDFQWRIIFQQKKSPRTIVDFYIDQSIAQHDDIKIYRLAIQDDFYCQEVTLTYDQQSHKLFLDQDKDSVPLKEMNTTIFSSANSESRFFRLELIPSAYAQTTDHKMPLDPKIMAERLESNDSIVRPQARADLAAHGSDALSVRLKRPKFLLASFRILTALPCLVWNWNCFLEPR